MPTPMLTPAPAGADDSIAMQTAADAAKRTRVRSMKILLEKCFESDKTRLILTVLVLASNR
jgi:hypothetical protein